MKKIKALLAILLVSLLFIPGVKANAASPTDEILNYEITVHVNEDATLTMVYHIVWQALYDGGGSDPLTWVKIGIPNDHATGIKALSDNIKSASYLGSGGSYVRVDFKDKYYKNDIVDFSFELNQDYMYEMNVLKEGETVFYFTPGWFDDFAVDRISVTWDSNRAIGWSHGASQEGGKLLWTGSLSAGQKLTEISVTYPNTAFRFDESKMVQKGGNSYEDDDDDAFATLFGVGFVIFIIAKLFSKVSSYTSGAGFNSKPKTKKKVTRTLIKYYPTCPGCGAARPENADKCEYCGRSFIESEEVVEEKEIADPAKYANEGTFRYGDSPNTYVRVHVTHVPIVVHSTGRSSCAHSSCACAHSCACACACACAGGGRAGCSTKDFYNTNLKLSQLKRMKKK
ncbi:MAG: zinc ribbon domain-containing protein [Lachnospiraceae bacterium]|nr:zinc ribbon domain-containing protein [Lachnospiraceae bacterium]